MKKHTKRHICLALILALSLLLCACGSQAPSPEAPSAPETTAPPETSAPTEATEETVPAQILPEFYTVNGISYAGALGEPLLGEAAAELSADDAASQITNVGDAIRYIQALSPFNEPETPCLLFGDLLEGDYDEVGMVHMWRPDNHYYLSYIQQDGIFYPFSPFDFELAYGETLWPSAPGSGEDLDALCQVLMATFPYNRNDEPMESYNVMILSSIDCHQANGILYAASLGAPVLGEAAAELSADDAAPQITNVGDAIHYMKTLPRFNDTEKACRVFADLLEGDYDEVGILHLWQPANHYFLAYVQQDGLFYPFDPANFRSGRGGYLWPAAKTADTDLDALCQTLMPTFPYDRNCEPMASYSIEMVSSADFHKANGILYAASLGESVLGEAAAELPADDAAPQITNVGDAIHYMNGLTRFKETKEASQLFAALLEGDYDQVGLIELSNPDNRYYLAYIQQGGRFYPFDPFNFRNGYGDVIWPSPKASGTDLNALCEELMAAFPDNYDRNGEPMTAYQIGAFFE